MDFLQVIKNRIDDQMADRKALHQDLLTPEFHVKRIAGSINEIIPQIEALDLDAEALKQEFILILNQVPSVVESSWTSQINLIKSTDGSIEKYHEMQELYSEWQKHQAAAQAREAELKKEIADGKIKEPSRITGRERKVGNRPPITIGKYRKLSDAFEGEDE